MLTFPKTLTGSLQDLWQACLDLLPQLEDYIIPDITIGTSSTGVAHGLSAAPALVIPVLHADARIWRSATPDARFFYFAASTSVVCDFLVLP